MAENNTGPVETGAEMDYAEHEKTYNMFLNLTKYGTLACVVILIAMAFGFFTAAGFFTSTLLAIILLAIGIYVLK
ncbi:aa3-type cytochrome c oxidase subunit IV [Hoeflea prorocentri]|uniref:Aa3-type cytochrome c oxidase subunit IV n=1 Tax=Hoeflea prorocentri TaxID=1922333 RepID=A0A9X3UES8_9HYPH|nr:aa3-type cytochrome c oxidase subunit IV [Hoeflea prorocentri]MCY6379204.1 aa3-type cytochrome c oxidase subunit IV [Hoeflea prorocentri]MDA5397005.1 aa3-type cytochrome c oxidase subunit IV [Hoeflea prorocentri]